MFLVSTRLGLIACQYLIQSYYENRYISAPEISERYNMNVRALMPALRQMTRSGLLHSRTGGVEPGFIFSRDPKDMFVLELLTVLEGDNEFYCCKEFIQGIKCDCNSVSDCSMFNVFCNIIEHAKQKLSKISLVEYCKR